MMAVKQGSGGGGGAIAGLIVFGKG